MKTNFTARFIDGTAALKLREKPVRTRIISLQHVNQDVSPAEKIRSASAHARRIVASSEMCRSLATEDFRGCAYGLFTRRGIGALAAGSSAMAIASLIIGC